MFALGIARAESYSPGRHGENDQLILEYTARALTQLGCTVDLVAESEAERRELDAPFMFSMCQGPSATARLLKVEASGKLIVNSPRAVQNCYRSQLFRRLGEDRRLFPETEIVSTDSPHLETLDWSGSWPLWVKRGDAQTTCNTDVQRVEGRAELRKILTDFRRRDISTAIVQAHVAGMVVKFYGIVGSPFFRFYAESDRDLSPLQVGRMRPQIERLVTRLGLEIYGGDCVIAPDGRLFIIDVNDWPSFANFREEAAIAIAQHLLGRFQGQLAQDSRLAQKLPV